MTNSSLFRLGLIVLLAAIGLSARADDPASPAWTSLFDGKTLNHWVVKGGNATYKVEDGMIVGTTGGKGAINTFLCTERDYGDFELEFDVLVDNPLNSGVQIRSHTYDKPTPQPSGGKRIRQIGEVYGYQCEIAANDKGTSGNFWDEARWTRWHDDLTGKPGAGAAFKKEQWNHYRIVAQGDHIRSWVNGIACADFHDSLDATGFIGLQVHHMRADAGPYHVRFRNLRIRELSANERLK